MEIRLFLMAQRYKFESKSQHSDLLGATLLVVSNGSKIQIWKQITTECLHNAWKYGLFLMAQRYKFESKSQLSIQQKGQNGGCF